MRIAVCGAVGWADVATIEHQLDELLARHRSLVLITGMASGADHIARQWANMNGIEVLAECLDPGSYPGPMHDYNHRMISWNPQLVLAFKADFDPDVRPNGYEPGTEHLVRIANENGITVNVFTAPKRE